MTRLSSSSAHWAVTPTAARRISYDESLVFEEVHESTYIEAGFELVEVPVGPVADRAAVITGVLARRIPQ